jgi:two-component system response regulator YesN
MYTVMVVDDEPIVRKGLISFIDWSLLDCVIIHEASNGIEALDKIIERCPDIIITDIKMPGMNGLELSEKIYKDFPQTKLIFLTGYSDFSYAQSAIRFGIVDYIVKASAIENISSAVEKAKKIISKERASNLKLKIFEKETSDALFYRYYDDSKINNIVFNNNTSRFDLSQYINKIIDNITLNDIEALMLLVDNLAEEQNKIRASSHKVKISYIKLSTALEELLHNYNLSFSSVFPDSADVYSEILTKNSLLELVSFIKEILAASCRCLCSNKAQNNYIVKKAKEYIVQNYNKKISLKDVAAHLHINSSYLSRLYSKDTGETIIETINKLKIEKAKVLLKESNMKTNEISLAVGIEDAAYFSHLFKKHSSLSPMEYRSITLLKR